MTRRRRQDSPAASADLLAEAPLPRRAAPGEDDPEAVEAGAAHAVALAMGAAARAQHRAYAEALRARPGDPHLAACLRRFAAIEAEAMAALGRHDLPPLAADRPGPGLFGGPL